jgi:hypothetical protein
VLQRCRIEAKRSLLRTDFSIQLLCRTGPEGKSRTNLEFSINNNLATITNVTWEENIITSAQIDIDELSQASSEYFVRVLKHCSNVMPELITDKKICEWLTDLAIPTFKQNN